MVLVSDGFDGVPWLERVYQAGSLWDAAEMGAPADVHCYTPAEFERKREALPVVRWAAERGLDLLAVLSPAAPTAAPCARAPGGRNRLDRKPDPRYHR